jgi:hypothetical protein
MALRIRFQGPTGSTFGFSIERLVDGLLYDFSTSTFSSNPTTLVLALPENTSRFPGQYRISLGPTPAAQFTDGDYAVVILDQLANIVVGQFAVVMHAGDDTTQIPGGPVASVTAPVTVGTNSDKVGYALTQSFPANFNALAIASGGTVTAGTVVDKNGYSLTQGFPANFNSLSISVGGSVTSASVTAPVTVGTNNDKSGYGLTQAFPANFASTSISASGGIMVGAYATGQDPASLVLALPANKLTTDGSGSVIASTVTDKSGYVLAASGFDAIAVEQGINTRQALALILATSAGTLTGAGTGTILIRGANVNTTRITATTDNAGNRSSVTLSQPT